LLAVTENTSAIAESFNLGNSKETSIKEVIETVLKVADSSIGYKIFDTKKEYGNRYEDIIRRVPDVLKAEKLLGWKAKISLEEGIKRTVEWAVKNPWWLK